jgi:hypothetical protein
LGKYFNFFNSENSINFAILLESFAKFLISIKKKEKNPDQNDNSFPHYKFGHEKKLFYTFQLSNIGNKKIVCS